MTFDFCRHLAQQIMQDFNFFLSMNLVLKPVVLQRVWDFLGAEYIRSDIHLALQSHAVEEEFNNLVSHVLNDDLARRYFDSVHFYSSTLAHPELSGRLQGALNLWDLGCVNKDLQEKCIKLLKVNGVALDDVVCANTNSDQPNRQPSIWQKHVKSIKSNKIRPSHHRQCGF